MEYNTQDNIVELNDYNDYDETKRANQDNQRNQANQANQANQRNQYNQHNQVNRLNEDSKELKRRYKEVKYKYLVEKKKQAARNNNQNNSNNKNALTGGSRNVDDNSGNRNSSNTNGYNADYNTNNNSGYNSINHNSGNNGTGYSFGNSNNNQSRNDDDINFDDAQDGGTDASANVDLETLLKSDKFKEYIKTISKKFDIDMPLIGYSELINEIEKHCARSNLSGEEIKSLLSDIMSKLGPQRIKYLKINNLTIKCPLTNEQWSQYNNSLCGYLKNEVVASLKKEQMLQLSLCLVLIEYPNHDQKINIGNLMKYARDTPEHIKNVKLVTGMFDEEAALTLLKDYEKDTTQYYKYWFAENINATNYSNFGAKYVDLLTTGKISKNGHICLGPCTKKDGSDKYTCDTKPYRHGLFGKRSRDQCKMD